MQAGCGWPYNTFHTSSPVFKESQQARSIKPTEQAEVSYYVEGKLSLQNLIASNKLQFVYIKW